jgi:drug/metabolite transporter (DMT)-like permease
MTAAQAYALLALVTLIWAGNFPFAKAGLAELGPVTLTATRALLTAPVLVAVVRAVYGPLPRLVRRDYVAFTVISVAGLVGNTTMWYWGMQYTSPVNAGILGSASPVLVTVVSAIWLRDPFTRRNVAGIVLTALAVALTVARGSLDVLRGLSINRGDLLILASQLFWTTYTLYSRANRSLLPPAVVQAGAYVISAAVLTPLALFERPWAMLGHAGWAGWGAVLYAALFGTVSHIWYYQCVRVVGAGRAAVFTNLTPFVVIALSWLTLGVPIHWYHLAGATIVIAGVALATAR